MTKAEKPCRCCGAVILATTAWERRYPLQLCLDCRLGDRAARRAAADQAPKPMLVRLKYWREQRLMTQGELATRAGMQRQDIGRLEKGRRVPRPKTIQAIAAALDVDPVQLCG